MPDDVTLILPDGAWDYPSSHGEIEYYPYRLDTALVYPALQNGGPWAIKVPFGVYPYFSNTSGGYRVMSEERTPLSPGEIAMKRLRKVGGGDASCNWQGQQFAPDADGVITVPHTAVGELVESHGYEELPEPMAQIDAGLEQVHEGVAAHAERVEQLREEALAQVPEEKAEAARVEVERAHEQSTRTGPPSPRRK